MALRRINPAGETRTSRTSWISRYVIEFQKVLQFLMFTIAAPPVS